MKISYFEVDAFANRAFQGNPAGICPLEKWLDDATMQNIAAENNLAETAFFVPRGDDFDLRWFAPEVEIDLCGHATLASKSRPTTDPPALIRGSAAVATALRE